MKRNFTFLIAAVALLVSLAFPMRGWGQIALSTNDLNFGSPQISENFNELELTSTTAGANAATTLTTGYGIFNNVYVGKSNNSQITDDVVFGSRIMQLTATSGSPIIASITNNTFGTKGAFSVKIGNDGKSYFGIYKDNNNTNYAKASASVFIYNNNGVLSIGNGNGWTQINSEPYTGGTIEVCVIYNNTDSDESYGNGISLGKKKAHVYVNGSCVMNGDNPKAFTIPGTSLTVFRVQATAQNDVVKADDVMIYNSLPTAPEITDPTITVNPSTAEDFTYIVGNGPTVSQLFEVTGSNLTGDITASVSDTDAFEISNDDETFGTNSITITGEIVSVRMKSGLGIGSYSATLTLSSEGATDVTLNLTGTVTGQIYNIVVIQPAGGGTVAADKETAEAGETVTLTAIPASGYEFVEWTVEDEDENPIQVNNNQFAMPTSDVMVTATFNEKPTYAITLNYDDDVAYMEASPSSAYEGQTVTLTYTAETGYGLSSIVITKTVDGSATDITPAASGDDYTFTMPGYAVTVTATFISNTFEGTFEPFTGAIVEGDYVIYGGNDGAMKNVVTSNRFENQDVVFDESNITNPDIAVVWHIAQIPNTNYWSIYNAAVEQYAGGTGSKNQGKLYGDTSNDLAKWTITNENGFVFENYGRTLANNDSDKAYLRQNGSSGWGTYGASYSNAPQLYKFHQPVAPTWSSEFPTTASLITSQEFELTVSNYVSGFPTPSISLVTDASTNDYEFEDGLLYFASSIAGSYEFSFTATNTAGTADVTLTITVSDPVQVNYYYSANGVLDSGHPITQGQTATLVGGSNFNSDYIFAGWTLDPNDINNILLAGSTQTINEETIFYAVYAHEGIDTQSMIINSETENFPSTYGTANVFNEVTLNGKSFKIQQAYISGEKLQFRAAGNTNGTGTIYNNENFGAISSIILNYDGSDSNKNFTIKAGTTANPTSGTEITPAINNINNLEYTFDMSIGNYTHFVLTNGSGAGYLQSIIINYAEPVVAYYTRIYSKDITGYGENKYGYTLIASPINGVNPANVAGMTDDNFDLYRFNESAELEWENWKQQDGNHYQFNLERGKGYLYAHKTNVTLAFAGTPVQGTTFDVTLSNSGTEYQGMNLVGNPFGQRAYVTVPFFVMNGEGSGFEAANRNYIEPMEGIIVDAANGTTLTFTTEAPSNSGDAKVALNLSRNRGDVIDRAIVRFGEGSQLHKFQLRENSTKVYFTEGNQDFAVVRSQKAQGEMPVNFKAEENGTYTLSVNTEEMELNYLHLVDNMTGMDVDLLQTPSYTFDATTNDYTSRFRLVFSANDVNEQNAETFAFFSNGNWVVNNEGEATLQVIDVNGHIVSNETINGTVATSINATPGVYMLRLVNGNEVKTQKIVVK